ncbi:MAG: hypothetical protein AAF533_24970 [Acidobacteriota bacterium]
MSRRKEVAARYGFEPITCPEHEKVGVSRDVGTGVMPIHGMRLRPENGTAGWYLWAGEDMSDEPDFFEPLHVSHLQERCPEVLPFLELPPGWRFLLAPGHEDVWHDPDVDLSPA